MRIKNRSHLFNETPLVLEFDNLHYVSLPNYGPVAAIFNLCSEDPAR